MQDLQQFFSSPLLYGYLLGVLLHVMFKWSNWKTRDNRWSDYWRINAGMNIAGAISAIVCFELWTSGWLDTAFATVSGVDPDNFEFNKTFGTSIFAGYILDSVARNITGKIQGSIANRAAQN